MSIRHDDALVGAAVRPFFDENLPPRVLVVGAAVEVPVRPNVGRFRTEAQRLLSQAA